MAVGESTIEHMGKSNELLHDNLMREIMLTFKNRVFVTSREGNVTDVTVDKLCNLTKAVGYMQQCQAALQKNIYSERDIKEINRRLDRIPPEILQQALTPLILDPLEAK